MYRTESFNFLRQILNARRDYKREWRRKYATAIPQKIKKGIPQPPKKKLAKFPGYVITHITIHVTIGSTAFYLRMPMKNYDQFCNELYDMFSQCPEATLHICGTFDHIERNNYLEVKF